MTDLYLQITNHFQGRRNRFQSGGAMVNRQEKLVNRRRSGTAKTVTF